MSIENHKWVRLPNGDVNEAYIDHNTHKGPFCVNCSKFFCVQCEKELGLKTVLMGFGLDSDAVKLEKVPLIIKPVSKCNLRRID